MTTEAAKEIKEKFTGKWKLDRSECFEDFLAELGVNFFVRKMAAQGRPSVAMSVDDEDKIHIATTTAFWTSEDVVELGKEFEKEVQKVKMKSVMKWVDGKLENHLEPIDPNVKPQTVSREIVGDELLMTMCVGDVVCKRYYKRMPES